MLRLLPNIRALISIPESLHNYQTVRWARKPRKPLWKGTAKSKLFRIPPRRNFPEEEDKENLRLFNMYRTAMKSIRKYLTSRYNVELQETADTEQLRKNFEEDFARCKLISEEWNEKLKQERDVRIAKQLETEIEFALNRKAEILTKKQEELAAAEEIVRREKQAVVSFITRETLDEAVERAISNPTDYNFALDLDGNRIYGSDKKVAEAVKVKQ